MGFKESMKELVECDYDQYAKDIVELDDVRLQKVAIKLERETLSCCMSIVAGVGLAFVTCGASLAGTAIGARREHVAEKKLDIVLAEMAQRGLPLHKMGMRDYMASTATVLGPKIVTMGVDAGITDLFITEAVGHCVTGNTALGTLTNSSTGTKTQLIGRATEDTFHGLKDGVTANFNVVENAVTHFAPATGVGHSVVHLMPTDSAMAWGQTEGLKEAMAGEAYAASSGASSLLEKLTAPGIKATRSTHVTVTEVK